MDDRTARSSTLERSALARLDQARRQSLRLIGSFALPLAAFGAGAEGAAAQSSAESLGARRARTAVSATVVLAPAGTHGAKAAETSGPVPPRKGAAPAA